MISNQRIPKQMEKPLSRYIVESELEINKRLSEKNSVLYKNENAVNTTDLPNF